ncbi:GntR family transcriptional regulator [Pseudonocardia pini]|uniref:GntR family transcriptional regulator n=1 Tax=Pseudonocardia pini TaxID=2758030 RepID=UPI001FED051E|nr:GntR family transcriptional regulator [Pseudonocardia pini]
MSTQPSPVESRRIADAVRAQILAGDLPPGARIKQDEIAAELRASRLPVREALRILESSGLVVLKANSGAWVAEMTLADLRMSYTVRERIEPLLLLDSLPRLDEADVARLHELQERIEEAADVEHFLVLDREFHWLTYSRHSSPQLAQIVARLWDTTQHYRRTFAAMAGSQGSWTIQAEHRLLVDAIERRDGETAESVLALHIRRTSVELSRHPEIFTAGR